MDTFLEISRDAVAIAFFVLGLLAARDWLKESGSGRGYLAAALVSLAAVAVLGRVQAMLGYDSQLVTDASLVAFAASGYCLLLFRHSFVPMKDGWRIGVFGAVTSLSILAVLLRLPSGPDAELTSLETATVLGIIGAWGLCIGEPAFRFWQAARGRPSVERARLRALASGYGGILLILIVGMSRMGSPPSSSFAVVLQIFTFAMVPILHASFAPPRWLLTVWRSSAQRDLHDAMDTLIAFSSEKRPMADKALEAGMRLVGSEAGFIIDPDDKVLSFTGLSEEDALALGAKLEMDEPALVPIRREVQTYAILIPIETTGGRWVLGVISGAFTPVFGSEEIEILKEFARSIELGFERVELVERLQDSQRSLQEAQSVAHVGSWDWDIATEKSQWSDELFRIWGLEPQSDRPSDLVEWVYPEDRGNLTNMAAEILRTGAPVDVEYRIRRKDGHERTLHARGMAVDGPDGKPVRIVGTAQDITERKIAEETLRKAYDRERMAGDRLRELDEMKNFFLSAVSHDLRTPLTAVLGFSKTLERNLYRVSEEDAREMLGRISTGAERLERMLLNLLDVDRLERGILEARRARTDLYAAIARVVDAVDAVDREIDVDCKVPIADVDPGQLERIVENLLINAVRHTAHGSPIQVEVQRQSDALLISVNDHGAGIPDELKQEIFEPFRQGQGPHITGTGIGLSLVAQFAQLHGGRAWVEDALGGGSSFKVLLPGAFPSEGENASAADLGLKAS